MSSAPRPPAPDSPARKRVTLTKLAEMRDLGEPIVMVTAYDHPSAVAVEAAGIDVVLVGDSAANNVLGYEDTVPVTVEELLMLAAAVRRRLSTPLPSAPAAPRPSWSAPCRSAPTRPPTPTRSPPRTASSRRPGSTPSSSR